MSDDDGYCAWREGSDWWETKGKKYNDQTKERLRDYCSWKRCGNNWSWRQKPFKLPESRWSKYLSQPKPAKWSLEDNPAKRREYGSEDGPPGTIMRPYRG